MLIIFIAGCEQKQEESAEQRKARLDSFSMKRYGKSSDERIKEMTHKVISKSLLDTAGLYKSPIKIIKATLVKKEYSNFRDIRISYKNVSNKPISAIRFMWKGIDAFGEPADMGGAYDGFGGGFTDDVLRPGKSETREWSILSRDGKKVQLAWPTEIAFTDGTKWKLSKK
ncbi:hypothetical protein TH53_21800 [Pedobacter lusitanus]|uniref:Uncharacterized protein n=2 Tax=Pedobacter lusitanus TaxID=1503925 RepID=A0A0D0F0T1_9SPHI|nr:hypothetical protein TH53_21800 [Pedobacter lusitanus]